MTLKGVVRNGVVVMETDTLPAEGTPVEIIVEDKLLGKDMEQFIGTLTGPPDFARNHDHYIHGTPKK